MTEIAPWIARLAVRSRDVRSEAVGWARYIKPQRRDRVAIVTDTSAALPDEVYKLPNSSELFIIPIPVMIGDQIYNEDDDTLHHDLSIALAAGTALRTSRPSPGQFSALYKHVAEQGYGHILSIHLSSKLSGTADAARVAAQTSSVPVTVLDSYNAGLSLGNAVLDVLIRTRLGLSPHFLANIATRQSSVSQTIFTVPNLETLRKGGRISALTGILGQLLQVRPVMQLNDGAIELLDRPRSEAKALSIITEIATSASPPVRLGVQAYGDFDTAYQLAAELQDHSSMPVPVVRLPAVLAAHLGLGALGVSISPDLDYASYGTA
ncbi:DegV family protein [Enteractinococcus coprophilus]|uniref:DegV family protein with EDD domain n=1 Tax=Enteractinococcus coprophilus TaxID=1027633 RepID=A0A543AJG4_9MICC|nr:DegV family protein [Enteractinococcus coprophilus]TQL72728.1 DegV family protein with EDD domain [Enteractinococcus coprophilus]